MKKILGLFVLLCSLGFTASYASARDTSVDAEQNAVNMLHAFGFIDRDKFGNLRRRIKIAKRRANERIGGK